MRAKGLKACSKGLTGDFPVDMGISHRKLVLEGDS